MTLTEFAEFSESRQNTTSGMVTRNTPHLTTDTFPDVVVNKDNSITVSGMVSIHSGESQQMSNQR